MYRFGMNSFALVILMWPSTAELAADIGRPVGTVRQWKNRNCIPAKNWKEIVTAAQRRGFDGISYDLLSRLAADLRRSRSAA